MAHTLSIVVLAHNDESRIVDCLECLDFADELVVIDDNSTDRTYELAKQFTTKVFKRELNGNFSNQRNFALNVVHSQWVLFVDSDELVSERLKEEVIKAISINNFSGYHIKRLDYMWGRKIRHGEAGSVQLLRLGKKDEGKWHGRVHETWKIVGAKDILINPLIHVPHQNIREFVRDVDNYSTGRAEELREEGKKTSFLLIFLYPTAKFLQNYIVKRGYKDGIPGLLYAIMMSFHSFLVRSKLYQLNDE